MSNMKELAMNDNELLGRVTSHVENIEQSVLLARQQAELIDDQPAWATFEALNEAYLKVLAAAINIRQRVKRGEG